jgi:mRNA interferase MazF
MTDCKRGDVVLVRFVFSDDSGSKVRPAVVVSSTGYQKARREIIVAAITSNVRRRLLGEHRIARWRDSGLLFPSVITGLIRTVASAMIDRRLGSLDASDLQVTNDNLRRSLGL